jgi:hypothetical protein
MTIDRRRFLRLTCVKLDWRLTDLDRRSFQRFYDVLGRDLGRSGVGRGFPPKS